jgi:cell division protein FtsB
MKFVVVAGFLILVHIFTGERGLPALIQSRHEAARLAGEISTLRATNRALSIKIEALRSDPATIEAVARETLGLARPGEIVVRVGKVPSPQP